MEFPGFDLVRPAGREMRPYLLSTVALVMTLVTNGASFDEYTACMRPAGRNPSGRAQYPSSMDFSPGGGGNYLNGRPAPTPPPPCDFRKQSWCAVPGSGYPWHAVRQFVHENQGLMRRMYGEVRQISVLQAELSSNEVNEFDLKSTGRADGSDGFDFDLHALREAAVVKYTVPSPAKMKGVKVRKGGAKRGGESGGSNKMVDGAPKVVDSGTKASDGNPAFKADEVRLKEGGLSKSQTIRTSTDKESKVPISTTAELEETIWQAEYSSFEAPTTTLSSLSPEGLLVTAGVNTDGPQVESSSKKVDSDAPIMSETTTMDAPGSTHDSQDMSSAYLDSSMTPETPYTTTSYSQFNFYAPAILSSTQPGTIPPSPFEKGTVKVEEYHQEKLFQDAVKEEKEGGEQLVHEIMEDEGMLVASNTSVYDEGSSTKDEEESEAEMDLNDGEDDVNNAEKEDEELAGYPSETRVPPTKLRGVNACPVKEEVVAPFWANNTRGEILALLNLYPFEQYVHWEKCTYEHRQMFCREGCRCEQQYRLHRLLAYDPRNECRGIFSDWFKFPSCCVCMCYNIPSELRHTSRSPRNHNEVGSTETSISGEDVNYNDGNSVKNDDSSPENSSLLVENFEVRLLNESADAEVMKPVKVPSNAASDSTSAGPVPVVAPLHFYYYYSQNQMNPQPNRNQDNENSELPLQKNAQFPKDKTSVGI